MPEKKRAPHQSGRGEGQRLSNPRTSVRQNSGRAVDRAGSQDG